MRRLKLPRVPDDPVEAPFAATLLLGRRELLKGLAVLLAAAAAPVVRLERAAAAARGRFFTAHERRTLTALCERILPADRDPGAVALGAPRYIEGLLTAFERRGVPRIFAGGPFSGRTPFPDNDRGRPSRRRPRDDFRHFVPLTRLQELRWRAELYGSASVPGANFNDGELGPLVGLRDVYRQGLARVDEVSRARTHRRFADLPPARQDEVLAVLPGAFGRDLRRGGLRFTDLIIRQTLEGCFAAPEYGGNRGRRGWRLCGIEGDAHPLGYSIFSRATGSYVERRRHPVSTPNPDELAGDVLRPRPLSEDAERMQRGIMTLTAITGLDC